MTIQEVLQENDLALKIELLKKGRDAELPDVDTIKKELNPKDHKIFDVAYRPDKTVVTDDGDRLEKVSRVAVPLQKLIVKRAASFLFGNKVKLVCDDKKSPMLEAIQKVMKGVKVNSFNKRLARVLFSATEAAEYWYPTGEGKDRKLRVRLFDPLKGDKLYPYFDDFGDMAAFSREYIIKDGDKEVTYFETWTSDKYFRWRKEAGDWVEDIDKGYIELSIGKIPIVYARQDETEWYDVQTTIEDLETLFSNHSDTNRYHAAPKIFVTGDIKGWAKKGDSGSIIEGEENSKAEYLNWQQSTESVQAEKENLYEIIYSGSQTPRISLDAAKGLGNAVSGESFKHLFLDAHLKAMDKMEIFEEYLERRINILKAFLSKMNQGLDVDTEIQTEVTPFMINDEQLTIQNLTTSVTGGILSKKTAVSLNPLVEDGGEEYKQIQTEIKEQQELMLDDIQNEE